MNETEMFLTVTPTSNINDGQAIINGTEIRDITFAMNRTITVRHRTTNQTSQISASGISLYDHYLIFGNIEYRIIRSLTKKRGCAWA